MDEEELERRRLEREEYRRDFEARYEENAMINSLTRIATDLERAIIGIFATAGLLGAILFVLILRWVIEGH
jgi:hypothetical protein